MTKPLRATELKSKIGNVFFGIDSSGHFFKINV